VLVNLSNDGWYGGLGGAEQHFAQAAFRAVETGLPLVRATTTGITAIVSPEGTIVSRLEEKLPGVLRAAVPVASGPTPYARFGDWFAWTCVLSTLGAVLLALARPRLLQRSASGRVPASASSA
jgi:apolipoprotein N-acyltransferase